MIISLSQEVINMAKTKQEKEIGKALKPGNVSFITKCKNLRALTKLSKIICESVVLEFDDTGLVIKNVDEKVTHGGYLHLSVDGMTDYKCKKDGVNVGIEILELHEFMMVCKISEDITCHIDEATMKAVFSNGKLTRDINLSDNFKNWSTGRQQSMNTEYPRTFDEIESEDIIIAMKGVEDVNNEIVIFESNKSGFIVKAQVSGDDIEIPFNKYKEKAGFPDSSKFPVNQVKTIIKHTNGKISLSMGDNIPLGIDWNPEENVQATFMVAPRVGGD